MTGADETAARERMALHGESLHRRGFAPGSSGNISVRLADGLLVTPTNSCLGRLDPARICKLDHDGRHLSGDPPSKEAFLHSGMYRRRATSNAVVHLHSSHAVAVSCCSGLDRDDAIPALTPYYVMKVGRLPLLPYFPPGDPGLAEAVSAVAGRRHAVLLANHGPVVAGADLDSAVYAIEELEESAKLYLMLDGKPSMPLSEDQIDDLRRRFPD